jgi:hypothetical protein
MNIQQNFSQRHANAEACPLYDNEGNGFQDE